MKQKLLALLLSTSMLTSLLVGCGNNETKNTSVEQSSQQASKEDAASSEENSTSVKEDEEFNPRSITEGVKLTIAIAESASVEGYDTNHTTLMIEEALGVDLEFMVFPSSDFMDKLNVMVQSGDELPDMVFFRWGTSSVDSWVEADAVLELSEYFNNPDYTKNMRAGVGDADIVAASQNAAGEIYGLPAWSYSTGDQWNKLWVYKPWLDAVGEDIPETTDEFFEACMKIAAADPNGNGKADEIMLTGHKGLFDASAGWFKFLMSPFVYAHSANYLIQEDGQVNLAYTTDEWKDGLKYIKKFFDEGLIPVETLTQDATQYDAIRHGEENTLFAYTWFNPDSPYSERNVEFECIDALVGPEGEKRPMYNVTDRAKIGGIITADCENPEAAFLVADYMCSDEMSITMRFGKRGVDWDYWDEATVEDPSAYSASYEGYDIYFIAYDDGTYWSNPQNVSYRQAGPYVMSENTNMGMARLSKASTRDEEISNIIHEKQTAAIIEVVDQGIPEQALNYLPLSVDESSSVADILANLQNYVSETTAKFLTGALDIDAEWDAYLAELEKIGSKDLLEVYQVAYERLEK